MAELAYLSFTYINDMKNKLPKYPNNRGSIINQIFDSNEKIELKNYAIVPISILKNDQISLMTKCILIYLCYRSGIKKKDDSKKWMPMVEDIKKEFSIDDRKWFKCRNELRNINVIPLDHPQRVEGGEGDGKKYVWTFNVDLSQFFELSTGAQQNATKMQGGKSLQVVDSKQNSKLSTDGEKRDLNMKLSTEKNGKNTNPQDGIHPADLQKNHPAKSKDNVLIVLKKEELKKEESFKFTSPTVLKMKQNVIKKSTSSQLLHKILKKGVL